MPFVPDTFSGPNAEAVQQVVNFNPATNTAFQQFVQDYEAALEQNIRIGRVQRENGLKLTDSFYAFGQSMGWDEKAIGPVHKALLAWATTELQP